LYYRESPLHVAFHTHNTELIKSLLSHGADINITDEEGRSCLEYLIWWNYEESFLPRNEFFVSKRAAIEKAFESAFDDERFEIVRKKYSKDVVMNQDYLSTIIKKELDFDILEYFIGAPDFVFQSCGYCYNEYAYIFQPLQLIVKSSQRCKSKKSVHLCLI
jgi:ankyrin repeat protein